MRRGAVLQQQPDAIPVRPLGGVLQRRAVSHINVLERDYLPRLEQHLEHGGVAASRGEVQREGAGAVGLVDVCAALHELVHHLGRPAARDRQV